MIQMYKVPAAVTREDLMQFVGAQGSILNPILDANGNLVVSVEEWEMEEFQFIKELHPELAAQFELIDYEPIITTAP